MFDAIAPRYDLLNHLLSGGIDRYWRTRAIHALSLSGRERILDVCTGTADLAIAASTASPGAAHVIGIDFSSAMLAVARMKMQARRLQGVMSLARGDAMGMPLVNESVHGVTIAFGIRNVERAEAACAEIYRVLRPGGRLVVLEFTIPRRPVWRSIYLAYFRHVLPRIGRIVSRHRAAYRYLPASVSTFASPDEFVTLLRKCGFADVRAVLLTLGVVCLYTARRQ
jgi:demethylmenaquinone methyltransferase/2-methoxy-6-polyprenyl-1,4-benzoquinol methylase